MVLQTIKLDIKTPIDFFKVLLAIRNWTLQEKSLTETELVIYAALMMYDNKYNDVKDEEIRRELLFSSITKKKILKDLNITSSKLETYLNKIRKKGLITENGLMITYRANINEGLSLVYNIGMNGNIPQYIPTSSKTTTVESPKQEGREEVSNSTKSDLDNLYPDNFDHNMRDAAMKSQDVDYENLTEEEIEQIENLRIMEDLKRRSKTNDTFIADEG